MTFEQLHQLVLDRRRQMPAGSSTTRLFTAGRPAILEKLNEETYEVGLALETQGPEELALEVSQCFYYLTCLVVLENVSAAVMQGAGDAAGTGSDKHDLAKRLMRSASGICTEPSAEGITRHAGLLLQALQSGGASIEQMQEKL